MSDYEPQFVRIRDDASTTFRGCVARVVSQHRRGRGSTDYRLVLEDRQIGWFRASEVDLLPPPRTLVAVEPDIFAMLVEGGYCDEGGEPL